MTQPMTPEEKALWESVGADFRNGPIRRLRRKVIFAYRRWKNPRWETERLHRIVRQCVEELDAEHQPEWASPEAKAKGKDPIGCVMCFPSDGSWPCVTRMITDDLRALENRHGR